MCIRDRLVGMQFSLSDFRLLVSQVKVRLVYFDTNIVITSNLTLLIKTIKSNFILFCYYFMNTINNKTMIKHLISLRVHDFKIK